MSVCLSVCLSAIKSWGPEVDITKNIRTCVSVCVSLCSLSTTRQDMMCLTRQHPNKVGAQASFKIPSVH